MSDTTIPHHHGHHPPEGHAEGREPGAEDLRARHHAVAVDPEIRDRNLKRLRRIEGQVRGLQRMVEEDLYCADIMTQIASVQEALRSVGRELVRNHMKHCAAEAIRSDDPKRAEAMYEELLDMVYRLGR
jgi:DNA-binding FrmR family transcriptional regulator